jgi:hypothetical protein
MDRRQTIKSLIAATAVALTGTSGAALAQAGSTIKVGILHSLSGTMAISETVLKDTVLMAKLTNPLHKSAHRAGQQRRPVLGWEPSVL